MNVTKLSIAAAAFIFAAAACAPQKEDIPLVYDVENSEITVA